MMRPAFAGRTSFCFLKTCFCLCSMWVFILPAGFVRLYTFFLISVGSFLVEETNQRPQKGGLLPAGFLRFYIFLLKRLCSFLVEETNQRPQKRGGDPPFFICPKTCFCLCSMRVFILPAGFVRLYTFLLISVGSFLMEETNQRPPLHKKLNLLYGGALLSNNQKFKIKISVQMV